MLNRLINTGVHEKLSFKEQSKLRIFNSSLLIAGSILVLYSFLGIANKLFFSTFITFGELVLLVINFLITSSRRYKLSYHFGFSTSLAFLLAIVFILGEPNQAHLYFLFMPMAAMIVFDDKASIYCYLVASVVLLLGSNYIFTHFHPYYELNMDLFGVPNMIATTLLVFLGMKLFKTDNLKFQDMINRQKQLLEEKNKDITDSIHYARRIQNALMARESVLKNNLPDYFVLYKPKDIVSGDFYWGEKVGGRFLLAACDCTGHGVPGAFMSLLGVSFLNEITKEKHIVQPDHVFHSLRENIIRAINPEGSGEGKDGMDAVLCSFDFERMHVQFACANNPLWVLRNSKWMEFRPDKFPIGIQGELERFTLHELSLEKGDMLYLFTDGYADQFGGEKGKKFKYKNLQELLAKISNEPMEKQKSILNDTIEKWKGNLEQVDDMLIIGIRV